MQKYQIISKKGEGTFSEVLRAEDTTTHRIIAIKYMKKSSKTKEEVNSLREIQAARRLQPHPNIVTLHEVLYDCSTGRLALVMELLEMSLYDLIKNRRQYLPDERIMNFMYQLLKGLNHAHRHGLFHRDIKPENILLNSDDTLKIADFGSCKGVYSKQPFTEYISTRWYRSPECLLTDGYYNYKMDVWSAGCVFFEMSSLYPLFTGSNELDQLHKIHNVLGTPSPELLHRMRSRGAHFDIDFPTKQGIGLGKLLPNASRDAIDLMSKLLTYDEERRYTMKEALRHPYFSSLREAERDARKARQHDGASQINHLCKKPDVPPLPLEAALHSLVTTKPIDTTATTTNVNTDTATNSDAEVATVAVDAVATKTIVADIQHKAAPCNHDSQSDSRHGSACHNRTTDGNDKSATRVPPASPPRGGGDCDRDTTVPFPETCDVGEKTAQRAADVECTTVEEAISVANFAASNLCDYTNTPVAPQEKSVIGAAVAAPSRQSYSEKRSDEPGCVRALGISGTRVTDCDGSEVVADCTPCGLTKLPSINRESPLVSSTQAAVPHVHDAAVLSRKGSAQGGQSNTDRKDPLMHQLSFAAIGKESAINLPPLV